ncbi:MAG: ATP-dependent Clp protease ATP-binding subunit, partial [Oscillospiraceae bacterium]|nr:ATP-dependent Clp protease ATP-binding subunit [Oscillospiraceae bacterium]
ITDAQGRVVNFENTIIVMTSNAGSDRRDGTVGFGHSVSDQTREKALKALGEILRPEFINRVDEVICFNRLTEEHFRGIAAIMLRELQESISDRGITVRWDESVVDYLVKKSYSVTYGARNLRRTIQKDIENPIAEQIIDSFLEPVSSITVTASEDKITLSAE